MSDRFQALTVLRQARDILIRRLTEVVLESRDEILEDAAGETFTSHLETLQEQLGARLSNVNSMIANLQAADEDRVPEFAPEPTVQVTIEGPHEAMVQATTEVSSAFEAPLELVDEDYPGGPTTFEQFLRLVYEHDQAAASRTLAGLFNTDDDTACKAAGVFAEHLARSPDVLQKVHRLRHELQAGSTNGALQMLFECFGMQGLEAVGVLQTLRARSEQLVATAVLEPAPGHES